MNDIDKHTALETRNQAVSGLRMVRICFKVSFVRLLMMRLQQAVLFCARVYAFHAVFL